MTEMSDPVPAAPHSGGMLPRLARNRSGATGLILVLAFLLLGLAGLTPRPPAEQFMAHRLAPPSTEFPLGTDLFGRDIASRLISGAAVSLRVALGAVASARPWAFWPVSPVDASITCSCA